ncbi:hypothetical protein GUJ93_ZPchr0011g27180 [Zizania palustris]|uniref:C2H2-type domain-containing protein n=1 Tax=Zizania palustris TaxID=103762 RepID=A0A8J6BRP9_ZIZPA|nr:hypothetical protein GUJ93_ZPchr0011g27180 [Zizania palustris]
MPSSPMEANADKNQDRSRSSKKLSRAGSWVAMGFYSSSSSCKNRSQSAAAAGKSSSSKKKEKKKKRSSRSMSCAGSICSTKESSVSSRGSRRRSGGGGSTSSRSLMAPGSDYSDAGLSVSSSSSSFNSETTAAAAATSSSSTSPSSPMSSVGGSFRVMRIRKLSGCYQCHSVLDPRSRSLGAAVFSCSDCDEVFIKADYLELHRATKHAVSELGPEDTSRNIVEIIFQSSWLKNPGPLCKIDKILKVHITDKTINKFEQYKESVKQRASSEAKKNPRCAADGNELLRFHCTTFTCSLGVAGGTALCGGSPTPPHHCKLCSIIKHGFRVDGNGKIATMATSGRAHETAEASSDGEKRAMLVCRVVAGRVNSKPSTTATTSSDELECDSITSCSSQGVTSDLDELLVFSPTAILPCFVVIYSGY